MPSKISFMTGRTRCHLAIFCSVGTRPVFLSGCGASSAVKMAYGKPAGSSTFFRKRRMPPMGLPMCPGELNTYGPAGGGSFGVASRM